MRRFRKPFPKRVNPNDGRKELSLHGTPLTHPSLSTPDPLEFAKTWKDLPCPRTPRRCCATAMWECKTDDCLLNDVSTTKMIVVGGRDRDRRMLDSVEIYDFARWEWTLLPPLSRPREECAAIVVENKLYVIGGFSDGSYLSDCEVLDLNRPHQRGFTRLQSDLPEALTSLAVVSKGHWIYVLGGYPGVEDHFDTVYALNTRTLEWDLSLPNLNENRYLPTLVVWKDQLVVAGGRTCDRHGRVQYLKSVETLDIARGTKWTTMAAMPLPRAGAVGFTLDGNLILAGGEERDNLPAFSFLWYDGSSWNYKPFPAMVNLCPGNLDVSLQRERLVYLDVHREFKFLTFKEAIKPSNDDKTKRTDWEESHHAVLKDVESLEDDDLVRLANRELFGDKSPRGVADPGPNPRSRRINSIDAVSLGFKLLPDAPSDDSPMVIQSVMNAKTVPYIPRSDEPQSKVQEVTDLEELIRVKEKAIELHPSMELVSEIMELFRLVIERYEEADDVRHEEIATRMHMFLSLPVIAKLLKESAADANTPEMSDTQENQIVVTNAMDEGISCADFEETVDEVITSLLRRLSSSMVSDGSFTESFNER